MKRKYRKACFGGTFDVPLHRGHEALIRKAFAVAEYCYIGVTSDDYILRKRRKEGVRGFEERKKNLVKFLDSEKILRKRYEIIELDRFFADEVLDKKKGIEAIVVSERTLPGARGINILREDFDLKPLEIVKIGMVLAKDKQPISSTRIRMKEIDRRGEIKKSS
ncbi:MAG: pantetheine-phosphate adenylyltransferase [Candidatus Aenigmatarchaeota archaeon]|nr:MAG: pantetheine-phosphate adenylyltransferase [Candidatus Aenigmarchaeota archaeon]